MACSNKHWIQYKSHELIFINYTYLIILIKGYHWHYTFLFCVAATVTTPATTTVEICEDAHVLNYDTLTNNGEGFVAYSTDSDGENMDDASAALIGSDSAEGWSLALLATAPNWQLLSHG